MSTYLITFRPPDRYRPSAETFETWARWQRSLGARLKDRGNPGFRASALGNCGAGTTLGGYSLIRAGSLEEAARLAQECPMLAAGGGVEIAELTNHDDKFDEWLERKSMTEQFDVEVSVQIAAPPDQVFPYFTDSARYVEWMGSHAELEPEPGGTYRVQMPDGFSAAGAFVGLDPPHRLVFTWGFADEDAVRRSKNEQVAASEGNPMPAGSTRVTVTLAPQDGGTSLTLRHEDLPNQELHDGHQVAWETYLSRLVTRAAGGDPGADPHT
jgi:uncharacterized protein YndB with AHSA1/START domain